MSLSGSKLVRNPKQIELTIHGMKFAGLEWGQPGQFPVLALHGWLDNAGSFFRLAPLLKNLHVVAIDMAGHGQTDHRQGTSSYHCYDDIRDIFLIADKLGWYKFALLGHSRGAIIGALAAGTFPERITHLGLIEGLLLESLAPEKAPEQLANAITGLTNQTEKSLTIYPDVPAAIRAREGGLYPLSFEAAKAITERGLKQNQQGYSWSTDPRLLAPTPVKLTHHQFDAFIKRITAPCELIMGTQGMQYAFPGYFKELDKFPFIKSHILEGGHHLHMEEGADQVSDIFQRFLV